MITKEPATLFGRRLREARRSAGIPQDRLGIQIGLDEHTASARVSRYETGAHEPPFGIACKLAGVLHVPSAYFYCEDDGLAKLLLHWQLLSKSERTKLVSIAESKLHSKASS